MSGRQMILLYVTLRTDDNPNESLNNKGSIKGCSPFIKKKYFYIYFFTDEVNLPKTTGIQLRGAQLNMTNFNNSKVNFFLSLCTMRDTGLDAYVSFCSMNDLAEKFLQ